MSHDPDLYNDVIYDVYEALAEEDEEDEDAMSEEEQKDKEISEKTGPIIWSTLTPGQRDRLVAEKVMGWKPVQCNDSIGDVSYTEYGDYACHICGAYAPRGQALTHGIVPPEHSYTRSMDTAWIVIKEMNDPISTARYAAFIDALERIVGSNMFFDLFYCDEDSDHLTPERICLAALRACGVEIIL